MSEADIVRARAEAAAAKHRLLGSAHELQARLSPTTLAQDAWDGIRDRSETVAVEVSHAVSKRPVVAGAAAASVAALLVRKPLGRLFGKLTGRSKNSDGDTK